MADPIEPLILERSNPDDIDNIVTLFGTIVTINRALKTATVTYEDDCYISLGIDTEVGLEFLYNCPKYTGLGHTAFNDGDTVYIFHWVDIDLNSHTMIAGHSQIDITPMCQSDFIFIVSGEMCSLFDVATCEDVVPFDYGEYDISFPCKISEASLFMFEQFVSVEEYTHPFAHARIGKTLGTETGIANEDISEFEAKAVGYLDALHDEAISRGADFGSIVIWEEATERVIGNGTTPYTNENGYGLFYLGTTFWANLTATKTVEPYSDIDYDYPNIVNNSDYYKSIYMEIVKCPSDHEWWPDVEYYRVGRSETRNNHEWSFYLSNVNTMSTITQTGWSSNIDYVAYTPSNFFPFMQECEYRHGFQTVFTSTGSSTRATYENGDDGSAIHKISLKHAPHYISDEVSEIEISGGFIDTWPGAISNTATSAVHFIAGNYGIYCFEINNVIAKVFKYDSSTFTDEQWALLYSYGWNNLYEGNFVYELLADILWWRTVNVSVSATFYSNLDGENFQYTSPSELISKADNITGDALVASIVKVIEAGESVYVTVPDNIGVAVGFINKPNPATLITSIYAKK